MANRMVTVPDEMNQKMKERKDINWSAVACAAFAEALESGVMDRKILIEQMKRLIKELEQQCA